MQIIPNNILSMKQGNKRLKILPENLFDCHFGPRHIAPKRGAI